MNITSDRGEAGNDRLAIAHMDRLILEIRHTRDLGALLVEVYIAEISDYASLSKQTIENDVLPHTTKLVDTLLSHLRSDAPLDETFAQELRDSAVRRFHQGVSIEGLLRSYRLWGQTIWRELVAAADLNDRAHVEAAVQSADRIMSYVDRASVVVEQAFLAEIAGVTFDRSILRDAWLNALLGSGSMTESIIRQLRLPAQKLDGPHYVVVIHGDHITSAGALVLRSIFAQIRAILEPSEGNLLIGLRANEIIVICPAPGNEQLKSHYGDCEKLAQALNRSSIGVSMVHTGVAKIATSYQEAAEAASIGFALGRHGRTTSFRDVLLDHLARASNYSKAVIEDTIAPLQAYDKAHGSNLVETLRLYFESKYSPAGSARLLHVHPNTVTYRLLRMRELTGLDPANPDDLLLLSMGLRLNQLDA